METKVLNGLNERPWIAFSLVLGMLITAISYIYFVPKAEYLGKAITADVLDSVPENSQYWQGKDIEDIGGKLEGENYNFISRIVARQYTDSSIPGQEVFLIVVDAGNFHYPKVCFEGAGFTPKELPSREIALETGKIRVNLLLNKKNNEQLLSVYWICIDKKIVPTWAEQKIKQLYYSLFNKERSGLMVRVDISVPGDVDDAVKIVEGFLSDIYRTMSSEYRDYIFSVGDDRDPETSSG